MLDRLIDLLIQSLQFFQFAHVVRSYQLGVVMRFGKFSRLAKPGLVMAWPFFIEDVYVTTVVDQPMQVGPISLMTKDHKAVVVSALFIITVEDVKPYLLNLEGGDHAILMMLAGGVAELVETHTLAELMQTPEADEDDDDLPKVEKRMPSISKRLASIMRRRVKKYGAGVTRAQIIELSTAKSIRVWGMERGI